MINYHGIKVILPGEVVDKKILKNMTDSNKPFIIIKKFSEKAILVKEKGKTKPKVIMFIGSYPNREKKRHILKMKDRKNTKGFPYGYSEKEWYRYVKDRRDENGIRNKNKFVD
jgi:hypothetical protein